MAFGALRDAQSSILGYFKYYNFLAEVLNPLLRGFDIALPAIQVTLPIGISFYTFQALSYVVDVYRGTIQAQKNYLSSGALYFFLSAAHRGTDRQVSRCLRTDWEPAVYGGGDGVWNQALFLRTGEKNVVC